MANLDNLSARRQKAMGTLQEWRSILDKTYRYAAPNSNVWRDSGSPGSKTTDKGGNVFTDVYDLTLVQATQGLVNKLINSLIPQYQEWVTFVPGTDIEPEFEDEVARELQKLTKKFFSYIDNSAFYTASAEAFTDFAISTGALQINEGDDDEPLVFASIPSNCIAYEAGVDGSFRGFFRDFIGISVDEIESFWPEGNVSAEVRRMGRDSSGGNSKQIHVVEATTFDYKNKTWETTIYEENLKSEIFETVEEFPAFVAFRWNRRSGEVLGRGPAMDAMPASASLNEAMKDELIAAAFRANPMYVAYTDAMVNYENFVVGPGAILPVRPSSAGAFPFAPIPMAGDINFGILVAQELREQINKMMLSAPLGPINTPRGTATEATLRQLEMTENAAASITRIEREFLSPTINRILFILKKRGLWPDIKVNGKVVAVKYETPLTASRGQKEVEKLATYFQVLAGIVGPELAAASMKVEKIPSFIAQNIEASLELVKTEREILEDIKKMQEAQELAAEGQEGTEQPGGIVPPEQEI